MTLEERNTWVGLGVGLAAFVAYLTVIAVRAADTPLTQVEWGGPMLWAVGVGGGVYALVYLADRIRHRGRTVADERDAQIQRFGDASGGGLADLAALAALIMLALDVDSFWVAHTLFVGGFLGATIGSLAKVAAYREGIPS